MKTLLLLALLALLPLCAEDQPIEKRLNEIVTLKLQMHDVQDVAHFVGKMFNVAVSFPKPVIDAGTTFTADIQSKPLSEVLDELGRQSNTTWKAKGKLVMFFPRKDP